jgi:hypothetical protein
MAESLGLKAKGSGEYVPAAPKNKTPQSLLWKNKWFVLTAASASRNKAICKLCLTSPEISYNAGNGTTSTLLEHLRTKHEGQYCELKGRNLDNGELNNHPPIASIECELQLNIVHPVARHFQHPRQAQRPQRKNLKNPPNNPPNNR